MSCFLPCTPNPTTGFFFYAPRGQVIELDITVEQAMTLIMSAGMAQPNGDAQKKLAALAENGAGDTRGPSPIRVIAAAERPLARLPGCCRKPQGAHDEFRASHFVRHFGIT